MNHIGVSLTYNRCIDLTVDIYKVGSRQFDLLTAFIFLLVSASVVLNSQRWNLQTGYILLQYPCCVPLLTEYHSAWRVSTLRPINTLQN